MLKSLHISNYALIDIVDINFDEGLNIITGETGAGKSIMLGALSLILGGRADLKAVRDSGKKSVIEATFDVSRYPRLREYCLDNDIEWDDTLCILRREVAPAGRSRAFINDSPVTLDLLGSVAMQLVDIHSQHQNQLLSSADYQLRVIDSLANNGELMAEYGKRYAAYRGALKRLHNARRQLEQTRQDEDFTRFQLEQLDELKLCPGEQEQLEHDRDILANVTDIKNTLTSALEALSEGQHNAMSLLAEAADYCEELGQYIEDTDNINERIATMKIEMRDIVETLSAYDRDLQADPQELDAIDERLNTIYSLQQKHRVDSVEALIVLREELRNKLDELEGSSFTIEELEKEARRAKAAARQLALELSARRSQEGSRLAETLRERAMPLGMKNLQTEVRVIQGELSPNGMDRVEFLFAFNKNQPLMPVGGSASGGEISRLMLSIKAIIASKIQLPSIIFDEVDTGVSGDIADRMGAMMRDIAQSIQVVTITHLPQVAAKGNAHFKVYKEDDDEATHTRIRQLSPEDRVDELAVMLSGYSIDEAARANARSLLNI